MMFFHGVRFEKRLNKMAILLLVGASLFVFGVPSAHAATFTVNSLLDTNDVDLGNGVCATAGAVCTLRAALEETNALAGADIINFSVTGTAVPTFGGYFITDTAGVVINGPGSASFTIDAVNLASAVITLTSSDNVTIEGLTIINIEGEGIRINDSDNGTYTDLVLTGQDNDNGAALMEFVGSSSNDISDVAVSHGGLGMRFKERSDSNTLTDSSSIDNTHSGLTISDSNLNIVTNNTFSTSADFGMFIIYGSDHNTIEGNTISNNGAGMTIGTIGPDLGLVSDNIITDNIITGNTAGGIVVSDNAADNIFTGNTITGSTQCAISVGDSTSGTIIGGSGIGEGNVLSGNGDCGIGLNGSTGTVILGNFIGVLADGTTPSSNAGSGIAGTDGVADLTIGGLDPGEGNIISNNGTSGIDVFDVTNVTIQGNTFASNTDNGLIFRAGGSDITVSGNTINDNGQNGISITGGASDFTIGGSGAGDGNTIAGNGILGINIQDASTVTIQGNYIGLESDGSTLSANGEGGITIIDAATVVIGGTTSTTRNYIAGDNDFVGISLPNGIYTDVSFIGNYIGLDAAGAQVGSLGEGFVLSGDMSGVTIGGTAANQGNVIAGMTAIGITLEGSQGARIFGNKIGTNASGVVTAGYGNSIGIDIYDDSSENQIGGINTGEGNIIAGNGLGIRVVGYSSDPSPQDNVILGNSIYSNTDLFGYGNGIDLVEDGDVPLGYGPSTNDILDSDTGPNGLLNHPVILKTVQSGGSAVVTFALDVPTGNKYHIDFFTNPTLGISDSGFGEGEVLVPYADVTDSGNITLTGAGLHIYSLTLANTDIDDVITATATECTNGGCTTFGATSEFSNSGPFGIDLGTSSGDETALTDDGAYHILTSSFLGACINADDALSDDADGPNQTGAYYGTGPCTDDRDGVAFDEVTYTVGDTITASVDPTDNGFLSAWMDLDNNGSFDGVDEQLFANEAVTAGAQDLILPVVAPAAGTYNIRFRYTTYDHEDMLATGEALDGEVEDYVITTVAAQSENPIVASRPVVVSGGCPKDWLLVNGTCQYQKTQLLDVAQILGSGVCPANLIIHDFMKDGDRNGKYSNYNKKVITEVNILQAHINRILKSQYNQAAGPVDGIFKSKTKLGVIRLQTALNSILKPVPVLKLDGIVGPYTREAINKSCG
jgi:parallel beta-helix repeat protein